MKSSSFTGLGIGLIGAIVLAYLLIVVNFRVPWLDPFIIITALPGALAGICWMLLLTHTTLNVPSLTGAIMCMGVATANSILMVSFAREQLNEGRSAADAALEAGFVRIRPTSNFPRPAPIWPPLRPMCTSPKLPLSATPNSSNPDGVSKQEVDNANGDLAAKRAIVQSAEANVRRLEELKSFQRVDAPFSGVITRRNTDIGMLINAGNGGSSQQLFFLAQTDPMRVYINVPEAYASSIRPGHRRLSGTHAVPRPEI